MAEERNDLTQCPVCFELYDENGDHVPRILPCHCTLCQKCIGKLIKDNALECPQDRQKHKATKGVKSFSQNKYILTYLKGEFSTTTNLEFDKCDQYKSKIVLYCKQKGCQKGICPMCMSEKHLTHEVVNILDKEKNKLYEKIDPVIELPFTMTRYKKAKQQVKKDCEDVIKTAKDRRDELNEELDAKLVEMTDNIINLSDIRKKVTKSTSPGDIADKLEFVDIIDRLSTEKNAPLTYRYFDLAEKEKAVDTSVAVDLGGHEKKIKEINKYGKSVITSWETAYHNISAVEVLSDGSVLACGIAWGTTLAQYKSDGSGASVLSEKRLEGWAGGLAEVILAGSPCLAISFTEVTDFSGKLRSKPRIEFWDISNEFEPVYSFDPEKRCLGRMCALSETSLFCHYCLRIPGKFILKTDA